MAQRIDIVCFDVDGRMVCGMSTTDEEKAKKYIEYQCNTRNRVCVKRLKREL